MSHLDYNYEKDVFKKEIKTQPIKRHTLSMPFINSNIKSLYLES
jgi:hypothetical protein